MVPGIEPGDDAVVLTSVILPRVRYGRLVTKAPAAGDLRQILGRPAGTYREGAIAINHGGFSMRAREIMTKSVLTVSPTASVGKASEMLTYRGFSALPVVDASGTLVGIVTEADLIRNRFPEHSGIETAAGQSPARTVAEVMTTPVVAVSHDEDLSVLARVMLTDHRRCVPIVDGTKLVGVVTRRDLVRVLSRTDAEIAADVRKNLQVLGGQARWSVQVTDGEVVVRDLFDQASDRAVAQVLAEAVPGVIRASIQATEPKAAPVQG